jgi:leader peptidase (prepilin peptidase) / N-methyltransferase
MTGLLAVVGGVLGLLIGSFLNVVIYRVPRGESILFPPSHCPGCDSRIKPRHNVPVLSWLALRARCATCSEPISARYPLVEAGTAALFIAITLRLGTSVYLPVFLFLAAIGLALAMIDVDGQRLPGSMIAVACLACVALLVPSAAGERWEYVGTALGGAAALTLVYAVTALCSQRAIDPNIAIVAALVGFCLGWISLQAAGIAALAALLLAVLTRSALTTTDRRIGGSSLPLGMVILASGAIAVLAPLPALV